MRTPNSPHADHAAGLTWHRVEFILPDPDGGDEDVWTAAVPAIPTVGDEVTLPGTPEARCRVVRKWFELDDLQFIVDHLPVRYVGHVILEVEELRSDAEAEGEA